MPYTPFAAWLNTVFAGLDEACGRFAFSLHSGGAGGFFDWFFPAVTLLGSAGIFFIALGLLSLIFRRSRKMGFTILVEDNATAHLQAGPAGPGGRTTLQYQKG